jgi:DNA-binding transcriptional regulator YiaG
MSAHRRYEPSPDRARAIRAARTWAWMSERDLAAALGVSQATVRCWEAAVRDPGPEMAARIAVATRVPVSSLLVPSRNWDAGRGREARHAAA